MEVEYICTQHKEVLHTSVAHNIKNTLIISPAKE